MNSAVLPSAFERVKENKQKRKYIKIDHVPKSELPYRVLKERTGVTLGSFKTMIEVDEFIDGYSLAALQSKPTRRKASR